MQFMLLLVGDEKAEARLPDAERMRIVETPGVFAEKLRAADAHVFGAALHPSTSATTINVAGGGAVTDGPFAETAEHIGGMYFIRADDLDQAIEWARQVPVSPGLRVEVRPVVEF